MRTRPVALMVWLVVLACAEAAALVALWRFFVLSGHGQWLDTIALYGNSVGRSRTAELVDTILTTISAASLAAATAVVGFIALVRRRFGVAFGALVLIAGANVTTQFLKYGLTRPDLGIDLERTTTGNSLPSGHATVAASVAAAVVLVVPPRLRGLCALLGAVGVAAAGVATLSAGWHRPSDAVAALLVTGIWACVAGLVIVNVQGSHGAVEYGPASRFALLTLAVGGLVLIGGAALAANLTDQLWPTPPADFGRAGLMLAYAGGATGIAGAACLLIASVVATVHRVVPRAMYDNDHDHDRARVGLQQGVGVQ